MAQQVLTCVLARLAHAHMSGRSIALQCLPFYLLVLALIYELASSCLLLTGLPRRMLRKVRAVRQLHRLHVAKRRASVQQLLLAQAGQRSTFVYSQSGRHIRMALRDSTTAVAHGWGVSQSGVGWRGESFRSHARGAVAARTIISRSAASRP